MSSANPIMRRLAELQAQWSRFAEDDSAILLRWVITDPYDWPLVRAFFDVEASEASVFPDLFVKLESPFESRTNHGRTLALELATRYQQMRPALAEAEVNTDWRAPARSPGGTDVARLHEVAASLHAHHEPFFRRLALVLAPAAGARPPARRAWVAPAV